MRHNGKRQELEEKAKMAREGLIRTVHEMREDLRRTVNAEAWVKRYPITTIGMAFLAGFFIDNPILIRQGIETVSRVAKRILPGLVLQAVKNRP